MTVKFSSGGRLIGPGGRLTGPGGRVLARAGVFWARAGVFWPGRACFGPGAGVLWARAGGVLTGESREEDTRDRTVITDTLFAHHNPVSLPAKAIGLNLN